MSLFDTFYLLKCKAAADFKVYLFWDTRLENNNNNDTDTDNDDDNDDDDDDNDNFIHFLVHLQFIIVKREDEEKIWVWKLKQPKVFKSASSYYVSKDT